MPPAGVCPGSGVHSLLGQALARRRSDLLPLRSWAQRTLSLQGTHYKENASLLRGSSRGTPASQKAWGSACCGPNKASSQLRAPASSTGAAGPAQGQASRGRGATGPWLVKETHRLSTGARPWERKAHWGARDHGEGVLVPTTSFRKSSLFSRVAPLNRLQKTVPALSLGENPQQQVCCHQARWRSHLCKRGPRLPGLREQANQKGSSPGPWEQRRATGGSKVLPDRLALRRDTEGGHRHKIMQ